uniref:Uncharacterized protein n=1 Tax=Thuricola similis TaxID=2784598 RepID=A0A7T8G5A8_9CILI|nr:hypothetical protein K4Z05_mgp30 [Thuricola similis]QQP22133.1 hypothetical protein TSIM_22 [Thuricola similis]
MSNKLVVNNYAEYWRGFYIMINWCKKNRFLNFIITNKMMSILLTSYCSISDDP